MLHDAHDMYGSHADCSRTGGDDCVIIRRPWPSDIGSAVSFQVQSHDGGRILPWHLHPEYEIHLVTGATGRMFIGDYLGWFGPRSLIMTGPNVPHNWIGINRPGAKQGCNCILIQFTSDFIDNCIDRFPELHALRLLMLDVRRGVAFSDKTIDLVRPIIVALQHSRGFERIELFLKLLRHMGDNQEWRLLSGFDYKAAPADHRDKLFCHALTHVRMNYTGLLRQNDLAALCGYSKSTFSRHFHCHTGSSFARYVSHLRVLHACGLLTSGTMRISEIGYKSGFKNFASFERQFEDHMKMSPVAFRNHHTL